MLDIQYRINDPDVVCEEFDSEFVVLNLLNGTYGSFRGSGDLIWRTLMAATSPAAIIAVLQGAANPYAEQVAPFVQRLLELQLIRPETSPAQASPDLAAVATIASPPDIEVFADLADLILSDPIHDVDSTAGWPRPKADLVQDQG